MKCITPGALMLIVSMSVLAQDRATYVSTYQDIAISEMQRSGIPASIKLAQAILESNYGRSELARQAHNHFGIKCGNDWAGRGYHLKDDDRDARGQLVNSCFRVFKSPEESFLAHSDFLTDPRKSHRYGKLFELDPKDYKGWAHGLSRGGYATNPDYARLLIRIIEEQGLHQYDHMTVSEPVAQTHRDHNMSDDIYAKPPEAGKLHYAIRYQNDIPYITAHGGDNVQRIAKHADIPAKRLLKYNNIDGGKRTQLDEGERIYLQQLKRKYRGNEGHHIVVDGESLDVIAHFYGVKVQVLRKRNQIPDGCEPVPGTRLSLREKSKTPVRCIKLGAHQPQIVQAPPKPTTPTPEAQVASATAMREDESMAEITPYEAQVLAQMYTVQPKDTLYQIARTHGISVADLKALNNLQDDMIRPGQTLKVK